MTIINDIDAQRFSFNGVEYYKNFTPVVVGNKIRILNTYDSSIELTSYPTLFSDFEVDGIVYASVALLQSALLPVIYTRNSLNVADTFLELTDTPSTYVGQMGKAVVVNEDEDAVKFVEFTSNGIPLTGTEVGSPVTGDIDLLSSGLKSGSGSGAISRFFEDDGFFYWEGDNDGSGEQVMSMLISGSAITINNSGTDNPDAIGLSAQQDFSSIDPTNKLIYTQRQYVDNALKLATFTIELIDLQTVDFYAPDDLRINSITNVNETPTTTLKVNDVAYTLTDLISQGDKITVEVDIASVINLNVRYE